MANQHEGGDGQEPPSPPHGVRRLSPRAAGQLSQPPVEPFIFWLLRSSVTASIPAVACNVKLIDVDLHSPPDPNTVSLVVSLISLRFALHYG